jgi:hypothetical protein
MPSTWQFCEQHTGSPLMSVHSGAEELHRGTSPKYWTATPTSCTACQVGWQTKAALPQMLKLYWKP